MTPPRPMRVVFGMLVLAGVSKLTLAAMDHVPPGITLARLDDAPSLFITAASADTDESAPQSCDLIQGDTPEELFSAITAERGLLETQRAALAQRTAEVELLNEMLAIETGRLEELKQEVEALIERASLAHVADVERLVALYTNMKPRDAAAIMNDLDPEVMVTVLGTMAERNAAPILAALNPARARALSLILLERSKFPGDRRLDRIFLD